MSAVTNGSHSKEGSVNSIQTRNNPQNDSKLYNIFKSYVKTMVFGVGSLVLSARYAHRVLEKKSGMVVRFNPIGVITLVGSISVLVAIRSVYQVVKYCKELQKDLSTANTKITRITEECNSKITRITEECNNQLQDCEGADADEFYVKESDKWNTQTDAWKQKIKNLESEIEELKKEAIQKGESTKEVKIERLNKELTEKEEKIKGLEGQIEELKTQNQASFQESIMQSFLIRPSSSDSKENLQEINELFASRIEPKKEDQSSSNFERSFVVMQNEDNERPEEALSDPKISIKQEGYTRQLTNFGLGVFMNVANIIFDQIGIAKEGFTTKGPIYKKKQLTKMLINLTDGVASDLNKIDNQSGLENSNSTETYQYMKKKIEAKFNNKNESMNQLLDLLTPIFDTKYIKNLNSIHINAAKKRYELLMGIEELMKREDFGYKDNIEGFIAAKQEDRLKEYPHILFLHLIAKHLTMSPVWNLATEVLQDKIGHQNKTDEGQNFVKLLENDVETLKASEPNGMNKNSVDAEKLAMQNGNSEATNYRYNYSSLLGSLMFNNREVNWLRMGTPSIDIGGVNEPSQLSVLYRLYLDHCAANGEKIAYFGFQKGPEADGNGYTGFDYGDYEKNRTAAFIEASKEPQWKDVFTFMNFSLDQIVTVEALKLKNSENDATSIDNFSDILKELMVKDNAGFFGLNENTVTASMKKVKSAFFGEDELNQEQRWNFLILTYAMVIVDTIEQKQINTFHANCKDGIDRAAIINLAILMISQFSDQCAENPDQTKIQQNIEQCRTMFSHAALLVKGQAVIPSRAPLGYGIAEQLAWAAGQDNKAERAAVVAGMAKDFKPNV